MHYELRVDACFALPIQPGPVAYRLDTSEVCIELHRVVCFGNPDLMYGDDLLVA